MILPPNPSGLPNYLSNLPPVNPVILQGALEIAQTPEVRTFKAFDELLTSVKEGDIGQLAKKAILEYKPFDDQIPILEALANHKSVIGVAARRSGKTITLISALLDYAHHFDMDAVRAEYPHRPEAWGPRFAYITGSEGQAFDIVWNYLVAGAEKLGGRAVRDKRFRVFIPTKNGEEAEIILFGAQKPDLLRGSYLDGVLYDEFAFMNPRIRTNVIAPQLEDYHGFEWIISTPNGKNHFYELYTAATKDPSWGTFFIPGSQLKRKRADYARYKKKLEMHGDLGAAIYATEIECDFDAPIPGAFWAKELNRVRFGGGMGFYPALPGKPVYVSVDLGVSDPTSIWWFQIDEGRVRWIDYYEETDMAFAHFAKIIADKGTENNYNYARLYLPHDAKARDQSAADYETGHALTRGEVFRKELTQRGVRINIMFVPREAKLDSIETARDVINRSIFNTANDNVEQGVSALQSYSRKYDEEKQTYVKQPNHNWASHAADSLRYAAHIINTQFDQMGKWTGGSATLLPSVNDNHPLAAEIGWMYGDTPFTRGVSLPTAKIIR